MIILPKIVWKNDINTDGMAYMIAHNNSKMVNNPINTFTLFINYINNIIYE